MTPPFQCPMVAIGTEKDLPVGWTNLPFPRGIGLLNVPVMVPVTAVCWVLLMIGAMITHGRLGQYVLVLGNALYLSLAAFIAVDRFTVEPFTGPAAEAEEQGERQSVVVEVGGKRLEVVLPGGLNLGGGGGAAAKKKAPKRSAGSKTGAAASGDSLTAPMQGTIVKIAVEEGQQVEAGELVVVLEAMKMEQPINAHKAGTITGLAAEVGQTVTNGAVLAEIKD